MKQRKILELQCGKDILSKNHFRLWGWHDAAGEVRLQRRADLVNNFIKEYIEFNRKI